MKKNILQVIYTTAISFRRGIQWDRSQIRVSRPREKRLKNDRYYCDQEKNRSQMGKVSNKGA